MSHFINVNVVQYYVSDLQRAKQFYLDVLEWPVAFGDDQYGWWEFGRENETHLAINHWDRDEPLPKSGAVAVLAVEDARAVTEALRAKGISCDDPFTIPGVVTYGAFYDPDGNRVSFASSEVSE